MPDTIVQQSAHQSTIYQQYLQPYTYYLHIIYVFCNSPIQLFPRKIYTNTILSQSLPEFNENNDAVKTS